MYLGRRRHLPAHRPDRLSYERAEYLFKQASGGRPSTSCTISRLAHLGEEGWSAPGLMAPSGHENLRTLGICVDPSADALARQDPARRHRGPVPFRIPLRTPARLVAA